MSLEDIKALTFDTGGTILDWHSGFREALAGAGARHGVEQDWGALANELRRKSLKRMLNLGEHVPPAYNFDDAHRAALDEVLTEHGLEALTEKERHEIAYTRAHSFQCWPDFPAVLPKLRNKYICASFTILSFRIIIDTARRNGLSWDAVISCEAIGKYKILPEAYQTAARFLQLELHGRLPQLRSRRGQGGRLQDRLRAPARRVGRRGPAGSDPQSDPRHRRRQLPRAGRGIGGGGLGRARGGPGGGKILDDGGRDATDQSCEESGDLRGFARHDVAIPMPIVAVVGGRDGVGKSAGRGDIADVEDRHFLAPRSRRAAHPPVFIDGERSGTL
jgi:2-haloacid dehalogenase